MVTNKTKFLNKIYAFIKEISNLSDTNSNLTKTETRKIITEEINWR